MFSACSSNTRGQWKLLLVKLKYIYAEQGQMLLAAYFFSGTVARKLEKVENH